ncbi:hypothetical protein TrVE_jg1881 [Triparma verrucosa]|uniref:Spore protein YkvP/CgeB glycosyl transferase-like domain-containing protein n=1 Tax=Triparma verrucosa TaxID=1606542 RepID=A0A9W7BNT0_9STRA|nr:hypothetical protein TrVE_jg1881 [Triparma verrucosa]
MTIDSLLIVVFLILALHAKTSNSTSNPDDIVRISLHAQAPPSDSLIVGSILTTSGISSSLATPALSAKAVHVRTYYPFHYESANTDCFDLMIIEGYFMMISAFIHEARSWNRNNCPNGNELKIVYWSLDPDFPPPSTVISLDIDGVATNSKALQQMYMQNGIHNYYIPLAVDVSIFKPMMTTATTTSGHNNNIVFVGSAGGILGGSKIHLRSVLELTANYIEQHNLKHPDSPISLEIYGSSWSGLPEFGEYYRGVAPIEDLPTIYANSLAVLGYTMDTQRDYSMLNNRIYEVLSTGVPLISERFEVLEETFGDWCTFYDLGVDGVDKESLENALNAVVNLPLSSRLLRSQSLHFLISSSHSYADRTISFLKFYSQLKSLPPSPRPSLPSLCIISEESPSTLLSLQASLSKIYSTKILPASSLIDLPNNVDLPWFISYDIIIGVDSPLVRSVLQKFPWPRKWLTPSGQKQIRGLILPTSYGLTSPSPPPPPSGYDIIYVSNKISHQTILKNLPSNNVHIIETYGTSTLYYAQSHLRIFEEWTKYIQTVKGCILNVEYSLGIFKVEVIKVGEVIRLEIYEGWKLYVLGCLSREVTLPVEYVVDLLETCSSLTESTVLLEKVNGDVKLLEIRGGGRDMDDYAEGIGRGVSKAICLGAGDARGRGEVERDGEEIKVEFRSDTFKVGRDGGWCLSVNGEQVNCVWQEGLSLRLVFDEMEEGVEGLIELEIEMRSNIYANRFGKKAVGELTVFKSGDGGGGKEKTRKAWSESMEVITEVGRLVKQKCDVNMAENNNRDDNEL